MMRDDGLHAKAEATWRRSCKGREGERFTTRREVYHASCGLGGGCRTCCLASMYRCVRMQRDFERKGWAAGRKEGTDDGSTLQGA